MNRGEIWWVALPDTSGLSSGYRRPVLVVQSNAFNVSNIHSVIVLAISTNLKIANAPGNIFISPQQSGLPRDSVVNVSQIITIDKTFLTEFVDILPSSVMQKVEKGIRLALSL